MHQTGWHIWPEPLESMALKILLGPWPVTFSTMWGGPGISSQPYGVIRSLIGLQCGWKGERTIVAISEGMIKKINSLCRTLSSPLSPLYRRSTPYLRLYHHCTALSRRQNCRCTDGIDGRGLLLEVAPADFDGSTSHCQRTRRETANPVGEHKPRVR